MDQILKEIKAINSNEADLRKFGLLVGAVFLLLGVFIFKHSALFFISVGLSLILFGALIPKWLKYVYKVWMGGAIFIGFFVSKVILMVIFIALIVTIKLILKAQKKDLLDISMNRTKKTYWRNRVRNSDKTAFEKQF